MHNVLPVVLIVLTLVIQGGAGLLSVKLENRIAKYVELTYPDLLVSAGKQPAAPEAEGLPAEQKLMFSPPRPLRAADPILDRWCKLKLTADVVMFAAAATATTVVLVVGLTGR